MRRLPWHAVAGVDRRAAWAATGVALAVAFAVVALAVPQGLRLETIEAEGALGRQEAIIARRDGSAFDPSALPIDGLTLVVVAQARLADGTEVGLVSIDGPRGVAAAPGEARPNGASTATGVVTLENGRNLTIGSGASTAYAPAGWLIVARETALELASLGPAETSFVLAPALTGEVVDSLRRDGYSVSLVPGVEPFFRASTAEVARALSLVAGFSALLVALFAYEFLSAEIHARRSEIGVWRALGMTGRDVIVLLLGRTAAMSAAAALAGVAVALAGLALVGRWSGSDVFVSSIRPGAVIGFLVAVVGAAVLGGTVPARRAVGGRHRAREVDA